MEEKLTPAKPYICPKCKGKGEYLFTDEQMGVKFQFMRNCKVCGKRGIIWKPEEKEG